MLGSVKRWIADAFVRLARCLVRSDERAAQRRLRKAESGK